jgi:hypothetical protein
MATNYFFLSNLSTPLISFNFKVLHLISNICFQTHFSMIHNFIRTKKSVRSFILMKNLLLIYIFSTMFWARVYSVEIILNFNHNILLFLKQIC